MPSKGICLHLVLQKNHVFSCHITESYVILSNDMPFSLFLYDDMSVIQLYLNVNVFMFFHLIFIYFKFIAVTENKFWIVLVNYKNPWYEIKAPD